MCELKYKEQMFQNLAENFDEGISVGAILTEIRQLF